MKHPNYYTALIDSRRPDVHVTLSYYESLSPARVSTLVADIGVDVKHLKPQPFTLQWNNEDWFGWTSRVRVLRPGQDETMPDWVGTLVDEPRRWKPHVTCEDTTVALRIDRISLMCKQNSIANWNLEEGLR